MDTPNPFEPPVADVNAPGPPITDASPGVPASVVVILSEIRSWFRLLLGVFVTGMAIVSAIVLGAVLPFGARSPRSLVAVGLLAMLLALLGPPVFYLARSASSILRLQQTSRLADLEDALRTQKSLWKYLGLLVLVLILLYAAAVLFVRAGRTP
jgi:hypothetical protein